MPDYLEMIDTLTARRASCRAFLPEPLPRSVIESIFATAQRAPSWCNTQPWEIVVTTGDETAHFAQELLRLVDAGETASGRGSDLERPAGYSGVRLARRRECGWKLFEAVGVTRGARQASARQARRNFELFGAPHVAIVSSAAELGPYGAVDCGVYLGLLLLAAEAAGVGAIPQAALANFSPFIHDYFRIGDDRLILFGIALGYRDENHRANSFRTTRASLSEVVRWIGGANG